MYSFFKNFYLNVCFFFCFFLLSIVYYALFFFSDTFSLFTANPSSFLDSSLFFTLVMKKIFFLIIYILLIIVKILCIFIAVAFFTVAERKVLGAVHRRRGPNMVGFWGLLQPIADALKLFLKELILPVKSSRFIFLAAPFWILLLSVFAWCFIPFSSEVEPISFQSISFSTNFVLSEQVGLEKWMKFFSIFSIDINTGVVFLLALSSLNVYGIILSGWSSNSKYAFLGSLRSSAQMISYEISMGLTILPIIILTNSLNFTDIVFFQKNTNYFLFALFPCFVIFLISMLAETNRTPFDLPEAEAELVAGYNVEYSAITFAMFFLGEYSSMILMAAFAVILFLGGWDSEFSLVFAFKLLVLCFFYILVRATLPRFRYDQLMQLCWKVFLPVSLSYFMFVAALVSLMFL